MAIRFNDNWEREQQLDRRAEQEPSHLHREPTPRPLRIFFFDRTKTSTSAVELEPERRPSDGGGK